MPSKPSDLNREIGERLAALRRAQGFETQREFARELEVDEARYSKWEKGINGLPTEVGIDLCARFGATMDWLYRGDASGLTVRLNEQIRRARRAA